MKKSILAIAVAAMAAPAAYAAPTVYGNIHLTILSADKSDGTGIGLTDPALTSNTSSIGVKGSEDLGNGLKAIYKLEWEVDVAGNDSFDNGGGLKGRDQFVGLKGGMGTIKFGTMSSNYKATGSSVDSLYRTPAEGRGFIHTQSNLHSGRAMNRGRQTNTVQYESPTMGGAQLVANTTLSSSSDETNGIGIRWSNKQISAYLDWIDGMPTGTTSTNTTESAMKVGAKYSADSFFVGAQYEDAEDMTDYNFMHLNAGYIIDANNIITGTYGTAEHKTTAAMDTDGLAVAYVHNLSSQTMVYVAYVDKSSDTASVEDSAFAAGIKKSF